MDQFSLTLESENAILFVKVWGFWTQAEARRYETKFLGLSKQLTGSDWYVLADISRFRIQSQAVQKIHAGLMEYATTHSLRKAANIISKDLNRIQIERLSIESGIPMHRFFTSESDARRWLLQKDV